MAFVDVETTGLSSVVDRVVEVGIFSTCCSSVDERWTALLDPGQPIPDGASAVHGITDEMLVSRHSFRDCSWDIYHRLKGRLFIAYNALHFDHPILTAEMARCGLTLPIQPVLDPMLWLLRQNRSGGVAPVSLATACRAQGIEPGHGHRVAEDCEALVALTRRIAKTVPEGLGELLQAQTEWARQLSEWRTRRCTKKKPVDGRPAGWQASLLLGGAGGGLESDE